MGKFTFNKISSAVLNLLCAALEVPAALTVLSKNGLSAFEFFTNDSNFFAFFACLIMGVSQIKSLAGMVEIPRWVKAVKYAAVCCMTLTAVVAACVLVPMQGGSSAIRPMLISYPMIFHHNRFCNYYLNLSLFAIFRDQEFPMESKQESPYFISSRCLLIK